MSAARNKIQNEFQTLRARAETSLSEMEVSDKPIFSGDIRNLMHELSIYQVELEQQNEELQRAKEELESSHSLLQTLLATAPVGIIVVNKHGVVLRANAAASILLGLNRTQLEEQRLGLFVGPESMYEYQSLLDDALQNGHPGYRELQMRRLPGGKFIARIDCTPMDRQNGNDSTAICTMLDISDSITLRHQLQFENTALDHELRVRARELEKTNEELYQALDRYKEASRLANVAKEAKDAFLRNLSHEFRTPLHGLMSLTSLLQSSLRDPEEQHLVDMARSGVAGLTVLFQDIIDLAAMEQGAMTAHPSLTPTSELLSAIGKSLMPEAHRQGLILETRMDPNAPDVLMVDAARVRQMLLALVGNAIKFSPNTQEPQAILLSCAAGEDAILFTVDDSGPGIPADQLERMLEAFVQGDERITKHYAGLGTGLALANRLATLLGGNLTLLNKPEGGLRATVQLPRKAA